MDSVDSDSDSDGDTALICTLSSGSEEKLDVVKTFVEAGASVNTPLSVAIDRENIDVCRYLISKGADVNARNTDAKDGTYLMQALKPRETGADVNAADKEQNARIHDIGRNIGLQVSFHCKVFTDMRKMMHRDSLPLSKTMEERVKLLAISGADVNVLDSNQVSPLMYAIMQCASIDVIGVLIKSGANVNALNIYNYSVLWYAIKSYTYDDRQEDILTVLIQAGAEVNSLDTKMVSPLMFAVGTDVDICVIRLLVDSGADVNAVDCEGRSSLMHAIARCARTDVIEFLVESGAEINVLDVNNKSPLCYTAINRRMKIDIREQIFKVLIKSGANVNVLDNNLVSPLMHALSGFINFESYRLFVEAGADIHALDKDKKSPLSYALDNFHVHSMNIVAHLIESGADVNVLDINNVSPLMYAFKSRFPVSKIVRLLLEFGANVNVVDKDQKSPLHYATKGFQNNYDTSINMLLGCEVDVNIQDKNGDSPLMYELKNSVRVKVIALFLEYGADVCARNRDNISPLSFVFKRVSAFKNKSYDGGFIDLVKMFEDYAGDVKGHFVTLPDTMNVHDAFDDIRTLCSKGADIEATDATGNSVLHQVIKRIAQCCCAKCFNLVHYLIVELNLSVWALNSANASPFRCALEFNFSSDKAGNILKLCVQAGYTPNAEEMSVVREIEEQSSTVIKGSDVTSLQDICCFSVRRALGRRLPTAVNSLPIPEKLKQRVQLTHVETMVETPEYTYEYQYYDELDSYVQDNDYGQVYEY